MSGLPDIDVEDWEKNTEYSGYDEDSDIVKVHTQCFMSITIIIVLVCMIKFHSSVVLGACSQF